MSFQMIKCTAWPNVCEHILYTLLYVLSSCLFFFYFSGFHGIVALKGTLSNAYSGISNIVATVYLHTVNPPIHKAINVFFSIWSEDQAWPLFNKFSNTDWAEALGPTLLRPIEMNKSISLQSVSEISRKPEKWSRTFGHAVWTYIKLPITTAML